MKLLDVFELKIPGVKIYRYAHFNDHRGYFTETYNMTDMPIQVRQINESFSQAGVFRGLHFQYDPAMIKMVRVISGHLRDFFLDIRINSPTYCQIDYYDLKPNDKYNEWIYLPVGIAHGNLALEETKFEYLCDNVHNPYSDMAINVLSDGIKWPDGYKLPDDVIMSARDRMSMTLQKWVNEHEIKFTMMKVV